MYNLSQKKKRSKFAVIVKVEKEMQIKTSKVRKKKSKLKT